MTGFPAAITGIRSKVRATPRTAMCHSLSDRAAAMCRRRSKTVAGSGAQRCRSIRCVPNATGAWRLHCIANADRTVGTPRRGRHRGESAACAVSAQSGACEPLQPVFAPVPERALYRCRSSAGRARGDRCARDHRLGTVSDRAAQCTRRGARGLPGRCTIETPRARAVVSPFPGASPRS